MRMDERARGPRRRADLPSLDMFAPNLPEGGEGSIWRRGRACGRMHPRSRDRRRETTAVVKDGDEENGE